MEQKPHLHQNNGQQRSSVFSKQFLGFELSVELHSTNTNICCLMICVIGWLVFDLHRHCFAGGHSLVEEQRHHQQH